MFARNLSRKEKEFNEKLEVEEISNDRAYISKLDDNQLKILMSLMSLGPE